jgi:glycosyltransferase involved in cell wall biosynthesis
MAVESRPRVLVLSPYFLPGTHGGGVVRALQGLTVGLSEHFEFVVACSEFDCRSDTPYPQAARAAAQQSTGLELHYLSRRWPLWRQLRNLLRQPWSLVYLNSLLSWRYTALALLMLCMLRVKHRAPAVLLAPRGELLVGAWSQSRFKKQVYFALLRRLGLLNGVQFHATSHEERQRLLELGLQPAHLAADAPPLAPLQLPPPAQPDGPTLRLVYMSRIDSHKNLGLALKALQQVACKVEFNIHGAINDAAYWQHCQALMAALPSHVSATYHGPAAPDQVFEILGQHEMLVLPTLGENHGYVIAEALLAGCVPLISNRTPWVQLAAMQAGYTVPIYTDSGSDNASGFAQAMDGFAKLGGPKRLERRQQAQAYGQRCSQQSQALQATRTMLEQTLSHTAGAGR